VPFHSSGINRKEISGRKTAQRATRSLSLSLFYVALCIYRAGSAREDRNHSRTCNFSVRRAELLETDFTSDSIRRDMKIANVSGEERIFIKSDVSYECSDDLPTRTVCAGWNRVVQMRAFREISPAIPCRERARETSRNFLSVTTCCLSLSLYPTLRAGQTRRHGMQIILARGGDPSEMRITDSGMRHAGYFCCCGDPFRWLATRLLNPMVIESRERAKSGSLCERREETEERERERESMKRGFKNGAI